MNLGKRVWHENPRTTRLDDHESIWDAWQRLFGCSLMLSEAVERRGGIWDERYRMANGYIAVMGGPGEDGIYTAEPLPLEE